MLWKHCCDERQCKYKRMKTVTYCFDHPVAAKVFFSCLSNPSLKHDIKFLRSDETGCLTIPVEDMEEGSWKVMLEWTHEGRDFCMERNIDIPPKVTNLED